MMDVSICRRSVFLLAICVASLALDAKPAAARDLVATPGGAGIGSERAPLGSVQFALDAAQPGDVIRIPPGIYEEQVHTVRGGTTAAPITLHSERAPASIITFSGNVLRVDHPNVAVEGIVFDGQYGQARTVDIRNPSRYTTLRNVEVRRSGRDCVRIRATDDVLIEAALIHRCLNPTNGRTDAHGIVVGAARRLTIKDTEIHTFSGDGIQADPARAAGGWSDLLIEGCCIWLEPLADAENGFSAGMVTGENAVDTKTRPGGSRAIRTIRDTTESLLTSLPRLAGFVTDGSLTELSTERCGT